MSIATPTLQTERLTLRMLRPDDFDAYAGIVADSEVMRYIGEGKPLDRAEAWRNLALMLGHWQLCGFGLWAVEERATGELVGRIGCWEPEGWPGFEVGWLLRRASWGRGYATEGARAALAFAFTELDRPRVISLIRPENAPSIRVAERLGERFDGRTIVKGTEALVYALDREAWRGMGL
jgi:RimJ/RimL family protein N-acetyltransferase